MTNILVNWSLGIIREINYGMKGSSVIVEFLTKIGTINEIHEDYVLHQFPIKFSYATSVHKIQGMTL